ncbi:MAG: redoxin domain-containing protein, partial [Desulfobulbaceae bacterium]
MNPLVTSEAPDFTAIAVMPDNSFNEAFSLSSLRGQYVLLFFYP